MITLLAGLVLTGLGAVLIVAYELYAVFTRRAVTITDIVRNWEALSVANKGAVSGIGSAVVLGVVLLLVHFLGGF